MRAGEEYPYPGVRIIVVCISLTWSQGAETWDLIVKQVKRQYGPPKS